MGNAENFHPVVTDSSQIPKYKRSHADDLIWDKIKLRTSNFTDDEVPLQLPLSWRSSSIGEEQSEISVTALDWSPPGLAKHKRCVLAVLTSNHVLSLWECTGRLEDAADWERVVVVNHALQAYNIANDQSIAQEPQHDKSERLKIKQRIRSFAWSHAPPSEFTADISGACHTLGHPYLAVSTESGQVHVLRVLSPYDILTPDVTEWTLSVVGCFQSQINPAKKNPLEACMPLTHVSAKEFVSQLAWSPWSKDANGTLSSVLAFVAQEALHCKIIRAHVDTNDIVLELGTTVAHLVDDQIARSAGAMRWLPKPTSADELYLVYPCRKMIYCLVFHLRKASGIRPTKRELGNAWDELSGIAFGSHRSARPYMQLTYHMNSITAPATGFSLPLTGESPLPTAPWQKALGRAKTKFGTDYNLQDNVMTKTYGIAASPLGDLFAVNSTFHPSDGVEYVIHSDQVSTLVLTPARDGIDCDHLPEHGGPSLPYELSAEAVLFSLQHSFKPLHDAEFGTALLTPQILRALSLTDLPVTEQNHASLTEDTPIPSIVRQLRESLFFDRDSIASSTEQLATFVTLERSRKVPPPNATIVRRIATEVVQLPHFVAEASPLSQTISHIHSLILAKLDAREGRDNGGLLADINDVDVERFDNMIHMSESPRQRPRITHNVQSPIHSVHPEMMMESLSSQLDLGHRTADFFDDTDEDSPIDTRVEASEIGLATDGAQHSTLEEKKPENRLRATPGQSQSSRQNHSSPPQPLGHHDQTTSATQHVVELHGSDSVASSYVGSVEELTIPYPSRRSNNNHTFSSVSQKHRGRVPETSIPDDESPMLVKQRNASQMLDALDLTLQALLQDDQTCNDGLRRQSHTFPHRGSRHISSNIRASRRRPASAPAKKVSMIPPPIELGTAKSLAHNVHITTPYPFEPIRRKTFEPCTPLSPDTLASTRGTAESILTLNISHQNQHSRPRIATIVIPTSSDFHTFKLASTPEKDSHFATLDFDDAAFFAALKASYNSLVGPWRWFSARTLTKIEVTGSAKYEEFFRYTSGRWLWDEEEQLRDRYKRFNVEGLKSVAAASVGAKACVSITKLAEGGSNKVFRLVMDDSSVVIARIPTPNAGPPFKTTASEVATMDFARTILEIPVPKVFSWSAQADNEVESEYIIMEEATGTPLWKVWEKMDISDKHRIVNDIVAIEKKFLSSSFTLYGNLYYAADAFPGCQPAILANNMSRKEEMQNGYVIGPVVDRDFWKQDRATMKISRGPWKSAQAYLEAIAQREIAWIETYAKTESAYDSSVVSDAQQSPGSHISLYRKFLSVSPYILPDEERLVRSTIWHWDLHAPNIFVNENGITSIIDWQDVWAGPLFLQARHPKLVDYNGDVTTEFPEDYEDLTDPEEKSRIRKQVEKSIVLWTYESETRDINPDLHDILHIPHGRTRRQTVDYSANTWDGDIMPFRQCLIRVARHFEEFNTKVPCPISFSDDELEEHYRDGAGWNDKADFWDSLHGFVERDGYTSPETYEQALEFFAELREQGLQDMTGAKREMFEEHTRWAIRKDTNR
ncbi:hypothetical protein MBLNU459_g5928t1 [Dothideomycetes sp. NU459]